MIFDKMGIEGYILKGQQRYRRVNRDNVVVVLAVKKKYEVLLLHCLRFLLFYWLVAEIYSQIRKSSPDYWIGGVRYALNYKPLY